MSDLQNLFAEMVKDARNLTATLTDDELATMNMMIQADFGDPTKRPGFEKIAAAYGTSGSALRNALKKALADEVNSRPAFQ